MFPRKIKAGYESEVTRMVREMLEKKPQILDEQRRGRAMWWDKKQDPDTQRRDKESRLKQPGYVYQTYDNPV